ncbi:hypothetical protein KIN20_023868 [Parelaphostrongylus tenuis]|uniref:Protein kinase domain-containing protein n=1 Tax=Parelaphostrongylus tenuis TaxID=148309 RepID=A0AAD5MSK0_PARTN|nr:hypothetical protein KIN20_023868 [Parelaphostrongylus tenuis]
MERLGRVWTRLSVSRPNLPLVEPRNEADVDEDLPDTKNEVFEMFSHSSTPNHRKSDVGLTVNRVRSSIDGNCSQKSSSPHPKHKKPSKSHVGRSSTVKATMLKTSEDEKPQNSNSKSLIAPDKLTAHPSSSSEKRSASFHEESCSFGVQSPASLSSASQAIHASSRSDDSTEVASPRRNSVFVKRGSVTMEPIQKVNIEDVYTVYKQLGTGRFGYIKLAEHKQSGQKIAIKFFPRPQIKQVDFIREYNYSFFLSPHPHIVDTYQGMHQTGDESAFFFVQELCPRASLREAVEATNQQGIGETNTKMVFSAVLSAVEFMHNENLVHRNLKAENILLFDSNDFSKAKLTDFGLTRKVDSAVKYLEYVNNYHAPELCETVVNEMLTVNKSIDIWALGVIFYYCLRGRFPWQKASIMCKTILGMGAMAKA